MFGIGSTELLVILVVALIVLGPKSLASFSRSLGRMVGEFRRVSTDFQRTLNFEAARQEMRQKQDEREADNPWTAKPDSSRPSPEPQDKSFTGFGPDSPIAQALQKSREEAEAAEASSQPEISSTNHGKNSR